MRRSQSLFLSIWYYYSALTGLLTVYYDVRTCKFVPSKLLRVYSLLLHGVILLLLPVFLHFGLEGSHLFETNPLTRYTRIATVLVHLAEITYTIATRWLHERHTVAIINALLRLDERCFASTLNSSECEMPPQLWRRLRQLLVLYLCIGVMHVQMLMALDLHAIIVSGKWIYLWSLYIVMNTLNMIQGVRLHFFIILWHICRQIMLLNGRLQQVLNSRTNPSRSGISLELWTLNATRAQLCQLLATLCEMYKWRILFKLLMNFIQLVTIGYHVVVLVGTQYTVSLANFLVGLLEYGFMLLTMFTFNMLGEMATSCYRDMGHIMRGALLLHRPRSRHQLTLTRCMEWFSLSWAQPVVEVRFFGVFVVNRRQIFHMIAQIILFTIVLVQDDYRNIWKSPQSTASPVRRSMLD